MSVPSANTRASRNVRSTASQPLIEKPASRWTGCAGVETALGDRADDEAEKLQREQHPGDRLQTARVRGDERVARANRPDDRKQPLEDGVVERNRDETEHRDRAQSHDQPLCSGEGERLKAAMIHCSFGMANSRARIAAANSQFTTMRIRSTTCAIGSAADDEAGLDMIHHLWCYRISIPYLSIIGQFTC